MYIFIYIYKYQDWLTTTFTEHRTDVGRFWPANTTKRSPNTNTNKPFNVQPFNEHRTQRSPLSPEQNVEHNNICEHNIEQNSERRTSSKTYEHKQNNLSIANRTSNTTSLLCEQNIQHNTDFEQNIEQNNLDSNRTSNTTESQSRTQQCANTTPCEHNSEHNSRIRTQRKDSRTQQ